jgi:large subunit ribosomal protein L29
MDIKEIKSKSDAELQTDLKSLREKTRHLRFKLNFQEVKNAKEMMGLRKTIARILTTLKEREQSK